MFSRGELEACTCGTHPQLNFSLSPILMYLLCRYKYRLFFSKKGSFAPPNRTVDILFKVALAH